MSHSFAYRRARVGEARPSGWIAAQARQNLDGYLGRLPELTAEVAGEVFALGRRGSEKEGDVNGRDALSWWDGESEGNWLLGWVGHAIVLGDEAALADASARLARVLKHRHDDGYVGMFSPATRREHPFLAGDLWTQSRILGALQVWAEYRGDAETADAVAEGLRVAIRTVAEEERAGVAFEPAMGDSVGRGHDLMIVEVAAEAARETGDLSLVRFAVDAYRLFSIADLEWMDADCQLPQLLSETPFAGHGAHTCESLRVPLLLFELTGDPAMLAAFETGYAKLLHAIGITGACKSSETIGAEGHAPFPFAESGFEYCAITELLVTLLEATRITGDFRYLDHAERVWLNAAQAARGDGGRWVAYTFAENQAAATHAMGTRWDLSPTHADTAVCCVPNAGRVLPAVTARMVMASERGISVQLYGPMEAELEAAGERVRVVQRTAYPFDDVIIVEVDAGGAELEVEVRIPEWCDDPSLVVDGATELARSRDGARLSVRAAWIAGSRVVLTLPQRPRLVEAVDGRMAWTAGPLVYSVAIPFTASVRAEYPVEGFADLDAIPAGPGAMYPPVVITAAIADARLTTAGIVPEDPWADPPRRLTSRCVDPNPTENWLAATAVADIDLVPHRVHDPALDLPAGYLVGDC